jgi:hypothetical protein
MACGLKNLHPDGEMVARMEGRTARRLCGRLGGLKRGLQNLVLGLVQNLVLNNHSQGHIGGNGLIVESCRTEPELTNCGSYRGVEVSAGRLDDLNILGLAVLVDVELEDNFRIVGKISGGGGGEIDVG